MGLRVSEIVNLKIEDIDSVSKKVRIEKAKGKKDRYVNLPDSILTELRQYYKENRPKKYVFEGQNLWWNIWADTPTKLPSAMVELGELMIKQ